MRIWIDLANSPHPLLFAPIAERLEGMGHRVLITARDHGQTVELAHQRWPEVEVIGGESPGGRLTKGSQLSRRVLRLRGWAKEIGAELALSHNSYAQIAAARSLGIRTITAMDFEHQPANHLAFRLAHRVLLPEAFPARQARLEGANRGKARRYPGVKEDIYVSDFEPDRAVVDRLIDGQGADGPLVVARTPPRGALYHRFDNPLFVEALRALDRQRASLIVLPRNPADREAIEGLGLANCRLPVAAVDSRSLIYHADLFLGGGGTMTREAARLGVPTWSVFAGRAAAVDRWLEREGQLTRLTEPGQLSQLRLEAAEPHPVEDLRTRGRRTLEAFIDSALDG